MSHFSQVLKYTNLAAFPATGNTSILYLAKDTVKIYEWNGSSYNAATAPVAWGAITGTLSAQTDLQAALDAKAGSGANSSITALSGLTGEIAKPTGMTLATGGALKTDVSSGNTALMQAYDVNDATYRTFITLSAGNTPSMAIAAPSGGSASIDNIALGATTQANAQFLSPINTQTGTTYTLAASDCGKIITMSNASAITVTLPQQSNVVTSAGFWCHIRNLGAGLVTLVKEGAETLDGNTTIAQYAEAIIERPTTTKWTALGGTSSAAFGINQTIVGTALNQAYDITVYMPSAGTVNGLAFRAGTVGTPGTYTVAINGVSVTGLTTVALTTARTYTAATAANTFVRGDYITITLAGTVAVTDIYYMLEFTRNL